MADQVSPLGSLGTGSSVAALPSAKTPAIPDNASSGSANPPSASSAAAKGTGDSRAVSAPGKPGGAPAKNAEVNPQTINAQLQQANSSLEFKVDKSTGISYFKVVDATTGKVIRQVPSADVLAMAQKLQDFSSHKDPSGILMDQQG